MFNKNIKNYFKKINFTNNYKINLSTLNTINSANINLEIIKTKIDKTSQEYQVKNLKLNYFRIIIKI